MLKKRSLFPIVSMLLAMPTLSYADANSSASVTPIDNPIVLQRADPWLVRDDKTGCYTFIGTSPKFDEIELRQACRLNDLKLAEPKVIWQKNAKGPMSANIWAPELHKVDGSWYIHFAAGDVEKPFSIRMYVLKNDSENPMQDNWQEMGQLKTHLDSFSLDATTFSHNGKRYLVWAQQNQPATYNSALWIAEMDSPTSIKEPIVAITEPTLDWEVQGYKVNEGAAVMIREGKVLLTYSASATDHRYAMGLLWADADADLLDPASWHKKQQPIFASNEKVGRFGPGHSSFVKAEDGVTDLLIYHSRDYKELQGTPLTDPNRHARARIIEWDENGFPVLSPDKPD
ncbi:MAG: glycoside hydrolase family 43 protein [Pseudoalteromonas prydzensis]|uniref:Family 43 glycosylhydrolase n=2 Tax=Pseudoalteromonas TaxID=53246 RepID=A0ABR9FKS3_9GAMM|nr:family 43 glycosylhydrolase [Pseudoalteromonas prydzensis]